MTQVLRRLTSERVVETTLLSPQQPCTSLSAALLTAANACRHAATYGSGGLSTPQLQQQHQPWLPATASMHAATAGTMSAGGNCTTTSDEAVAEASNIRRASTADQQPHGGGADSADDDDDDSGSGGATGRAAAGARASRRWTDEEHSLLGELVEKHGTYRSWSTIAQRLPGRTGKQCRERWINHMSPNIKKGHWTHAEELTFANLHATIGNHWSRISKHLPGRSDNCVKNHWNATLRAKRPCGRPSTLLWLYVSNIKNGMDKQAALESALRQAPRGTSSQAPPAVPAQLQGPTTQGLCQGVVTSSVVGSQGGVGAGPSNGMSSGGAGGQAGMDGQQAEGMAPLGSSSRLGASIESPFAAAVQGTASLPMQEAAHAGQDVQSMALQRLGAQQQPQQLTLPILCVGEADDAAVALMALSGRASQEGSLPLLLEEQNHNSAWSPSGPHPTRSRSTGLRLQLPQDQPLPLQQHQSSPQQQQQQQQLQQLSPQHQPPQQLSPQQQQAHAASGRVERRQSPFQVPTSMLPMLEQRNNSIGGSFHRLMQSASLSIGAASLHAAASGLDSSKLESFLAAPFFAATRQEYLGDPEEGSAVSVLRNLCKALEDMQQPAPVHQHHQHHELQPAQQQQQPQGQQQQQAMQQPCDQPVQEQEQRGREQERQQSEDGSALCHTHVPPTPPSSAAASTRDSPAPGSPVDVVSAHNGACSSQELLQLGQAQQAIEGQQQGPPVQQSAVTAVGLSNLSLEQRAALLSMLAEHQAIPEGLAAGASIEIRVVLPAAGTVTSGAGIDDVGQAKQGQLPQASGDVPAASGNSGYMTDAAVLTPAEVRSAVLLGKRSAAELGGADEQQHAAKRLA